MASGANSIQINLYIDPSWATAGRRMAALWGTALDAANAISEYPIIEYVSENNMPKFRYYFNGMWNDFSANLPSGFTSGWATLKISIANNGAITFLVKPAFGSTASLTTTTAASSSTVFSNIILEGYNYDPSAPGYDANASTPTEGVTYDIYWDNLRTDYKSDVAVTTYNSSICPGADAVFTLTGQPGSVVTYNLNGGASTNVTLTDGTATITVPTPVSNQTLNLTSYYNPAAPCATSIAVSSTVTVVGGGPVANLTTGNHYCAIQPAIDAASAGDIIQVEQGTYAERLTINKTITLQGDPNKVRNQIVLNGSSLSGTGSGIVINSGVQNVAIKNITVKNFTGTSGNSNAGIYAIGGNNGTMVQNVALDSNMNASGFYANGPVTGITIDGSEVKANGAGARGIVIWNGLKNDITITNNTVENNNCCGIELQDGSATGVLIRKNTLIGMDAAIGAIGLTSGSTSGRANYIDSNTIAVKGRFGIEVKNPNGTGLATGDGAILVKANNVSYIGGITEARDLSGICVIRRGVITANGNPDVPTGVRITNNTVSGFMQPSTSEGFGIVVEGTNHTVTGNILNGNDVGLQLQSGNGGYPGDANQNDMADQFYGRGNSPLLCGVDTTSNTYNSNGTNLRVIGMGNGMVTNVNTGKIFCSIQSAINDAATVNGNTLLIGAGTFNEQVIVNKELTIKNQPGATPVIDYSGTVSGKPTLMDVSVNNVTIDGLKFKVDLSKLRSAIIASGSTIDYITIKNDSIAPYGTPAGSYGERNAVSINYAAYRVGTGVNHVVFTNNVVLANALNNSFRSGISADAAGGIFNNNTLQSISQDILVRFTSNGANVEIANNHLNGGGVEIAEPNAGGSSYNIHHNIFDGTWSNTYTSSLRLKHNSGNAATTVSSNAFVNHTWGISLENYKNVTVNGNTFTPSASASSFRHITVNTKLLASTALSSVPHQAIDGTFSNNIFNGLTSASNSKAIAFYNHYNDNGGALYGDFTVSNNTFNEGFTNYIFVDTLNGLSTQNAAVTANYPEYLASNGVVASTTGYWTKDIKAVGNSFVVSTGGTPKTFGSMTFAERYNYLYNHIYDKNDNASVGRVILDLPVHNITHPADFASIQEAIDAPITVNGDVIVADSGIYVENVLVNKEVELRGSNYNVSPNTGTRVTESIIRTSINNPQGANPNASDIIRVVSNNVKINGFTIDGNNPDLGASTIQYNGVDIHARRGITNLDVTDGYHPLNNFIVQNNIIKNIDQRGINLANNGPVSSGNSIVDNKFTACGADPDGGQSILLMTNAYAEILSNVIDVPTNSIGLHLQNFYQNPVNPAVMHWTGNTINVGKDGIGIHTNLFYAPTAQLLVRANKINATSSLADATASLYNWGINIWSSSNASTVVVRGNKIGESGGYFTRGINLWNNNNTPQISLENDTIGNSLAGVYASNYDNDYHDANSSTYLSKGLIINNTVNKGFVIDDNNANTNNAGVSVVLSNNNMNSASDTGIVISGFNAMLSFTGATPASFTGTPFYITERSNGTDVPVTPIDATAVSFDGLTGATATLAQNFAIEDKINHAIDESGLGFVKVKDMNTFVTPNSFTATSATPKVQRGVDAAMPTWTEHVQTGVYIDNVTVNKPLTIVGEGYPATKINSVTPNGNIITIAADNVTIQDLQLEGTAGGPSNTRGFYVNSAVNNLHISKTMSSLHQMAFFADDNAIINGLTVDTAEFRASGNGFGIGVKSKVNNLTITGGNFSDNLYGLSSNADGAVINNETGLNNVIVSGVTFNNNVNKGMYFEKLNNASISNNMLSGNGTTTSSPTGFDVNLKFGNYANINIIQNKLTNNGQGSVSGGGITVKARNDGATYGANPASLSGLNLNQNEVAGSPVGLAIGNNIVRNTVSVQNNLITGATRGIVVYEAPANSTTTLLNNSIDATQNTVENGDANSNVVATCNWLGSTTAATNAAHVSGNVSYNPWLLSGTDNAPATTGFQPSVPCSTRPTAVLSIANTDPICAGGSKDLTVTLTGTAPWTFTYTDGTTPVTVTANASPYTLTVSPGVTSTYTITSLSDANFPAESSDITGSATVTVTQPATASISYANTPFCGTSTSEAVTLTGTNNYTGGTFTAPAGLNINASTGTINPFMSTANTYVVTYTTPATGGCPAVTATTNVEVKAIPNGYISGGSTATQNAGTTSTVTFTGTNGVAPYTFTYSVNGVTQPTVTTSAGSSVTTVPQTNANTGDFVYKLLQVQDASGCSGMVDADDTTVIKVVPPVAGNPNLTPVITVSNPSFNGTNTTRNYSLKIYNVGDAATTGSIGLYILKPIYPGFSMTFPASWSVTEQSGYYFIENAGLTINGNFGFTNITGQITIDPSVANGNYSVSGTLNPGAGGDNSANNNSASTNITKSN